MSVDKNILEAKRWLDTARGDLDAAGVLCENSKYAHACFHAQQAAEKAIKALWYYADADPWGHSIRKLIEDLSGIDTALYNEMKSLGKIGLILDRFYIPTRYPNGLPDLTPDQAFLQEDAKNCIKYATEFLKTVESFLNPNLSDS